MISKPILNHCAAPLDTGENTGNLKCRTQAKAQYNFLAELCHYLLMKDMLEREPFLCKILTPIFGVIACRTCPIPFFASAIFHHGKKFIVSLSFRAITIPSQSTSFILPNCSFQNIKIFYPRKSHITIYHQHVYL